MGSHSDYSTLRTVAKTLEDFGASHRRRVVSVHRTPGLHHQIGVLGGGQLDLMLVQEARRRGCPVAV